MPFTRCKYFLVALSCFFSQHLFAQITWTVYDTSNSAIPSNFIRGITEDASGNIWVATDRGVGKFDGLNWTVYNPANSTIPTNECNSITSKGDTIWVGTNAGLTSFEGGTWVTHNGEYLGPVIVAPNGDIWYGTLDNGVGKYDGIGWTYYDTLNSGLPNNTVKSIAVDTNGIAWFVTDFYGRWVAKLDGSNWTVYDTSNSGLPDYRVGSVRIESNGNKWISTFSGVAVYNDTTWTVYDTSNSGLPGNTVGPVHFDSYNNKWMVTNAGLAIFINDLNWVVYDASNSPLNCALWSLCISNVTARWVGTQFCGLYKMEGDVGISETGKNSFQSSVYPNPFSFSATIKVNITLRNGALIIYDVLGNEIKKIPFYSDEVKVERENLREGIYFYKIISDRKDVATGKIIIQ